MIWPLQLSKISSYHHGEVVQAVRDVNSKSCFEREEKLRYRWIHLWWNCDRGAAGGPVGARRSARHSWVRPQAWTEPSCWGSGGHSVTKVLLSLPPKKGSSATPWVIAAGLVFCPARVVMVSLLLKIPGITPLLSAAREKTLALHNRKGEGLSSCKCMQASQVQV